MKQDRTKRKKKINNKVENSTNPFQRNSAPLHFLYYYTIWKEMGINYQGFYWVLISHKYTLLRALYILCIINHYIYTYFGLKSDFLEFGTKLELLCNEKNKV